MGDVPEKDERHPVVFRANTAETTGTNSDVGLLGVQLPGARPEEWGRRVPETTASGHTSHCPGHSVLRPVAAPAFWGLQEGGRQPGV